MDAHKNIKQNMKAFVIRKVLLIILLCIYPISISCQDKPTKSSSVCISQRTCDKCLEANPSCSWCTDRRYNMTSPRCMPKQELESYGCRNEFIQENRKVAINIIKNQPLTDFSKDNFNAYQIQPQEVKMVLKKGDTQRIKMKYRPAQNYPLDLYYLMDLTWSMRDDKETLVSMGGNLANALNNLTENNRIGFGSFADKPTMPYIMISDAEKRNPCAVENDQCEPTYAYRHHLSLTNDINQFIKQVNQSSVTGNVDNLEGGLEALMQVLVCDERVGWSEKSRKIVVFASDGKMHVAGFGLLGGAIARNDKKCHLNTKGEYTASLVQDYPSLEEIYRELINKKVNVIFAVTNDVIAHYNSIHGLMNELTSVGVLQEDSSNILQLVEDGFNQFVRNVQFFDDAPPDYFKIEYLTTCGAKYPNPQRQSTCDNVIIGQEYEFEIRVTLLVSPETIGVNRQTIKIEEASLSDESLILDINLERICPCLSEELGEPNSRTCSNHGTLHCGMCFCDDRYVGLTCSCDLRNYTSSKELEAQCRNPDDNISGVTCSDRGECLCGKCDCDRGFEGDYCECEKCDEINGNICGGLDHGTCDCGKCLCKEEWSGENCECSTNTDLCIAPDSESICSSKGECRCGECVCERSYFGTFCENEAGGTSSLCIFYEDCVKELIGNKLGDTNLATNHYCEEKDVPKGNYNFIKTLEDSKIKCFTRINYKEDICAYEFTYIMDKDNNVGLLISDTLCPPQNIAMIGFWIALITTIIAGIISIIIWRICVSIKDKRDYERFEKERAELTTYSGMESPIYKSPITNYTVPVTPTEEVGL